MAEWEEDWLWERLRGESGWSSRREELEDCSDSLSLTPGMNSLMMVSWRLEGTLCFLNLMFGELSFFSSSLWLIYSGKSVTFYLWAECFLILKG
jgi:hypothetical protein